MTIFVHVVEDYSFFGAFPSSHNLITEELDEALSTLQKNNAQIIDIKINTCTVTEDVLSRTYLIIYTAEKKIS